MANTRDRGSAGLRAGEVMTTVLAAAVIFLLGAAAPARAQQPDQPTDLRWLPYLGCWQPLTGPEPAPGDTTQTPLVCVIPALGSSGVTVAVDSDNQYARPRLVEATGEHRAVTRDGCTGWESAEFSALGNRVYLTASYTCPGSVERTSTELMALTQAGEWLDVKGAAVHGVPVGVRVLRYRFAAGGSAAENARQATARPLILDDVVEAVHHVEPAVVEAWLVEEEQGFDLTGTRLISLAREGVPGRVTDVMVALSNPKVFAFDLSGHSATRRPPEPAALDQGYESPRGYARPWDCYSPYSWYCQTPYGWGYSPYGYRTGYRYGPGDGYYPRGGVVVVVQNARPPHGQMVVGSGYVRGGSGNGSVGTAHPRQVESGARPNPGSSGAPGPPPSSTGSSGGGGAPAGRTAHPKP